MTKFEAQDLAKWVEETVAPACALLSDAVIEAPTDALHDELKRRHITDCSTTEDT